MASIDLSGLTDAQLATELSETLASISRNRNSRSYGIGARNLQRESLKDLTAYMGCVSAEIAIRADGTGGTGIVEFGEPV